MYLPGVCEFSSACQHLQTFCCIQGVCANSTKCHRRIGVDRNLIHYLTQKPIPCTAIAQQHSQLPGLIEPCMLQRMVYIKIRPDQHNIHSHLVSCCFLCTTKSILPHHVLAMQGSLRLSTPTYLMLQPLKKGAIKAKACCCSGDTPVQRCAAWLGSDPAVSQCQSLCQGLR